MTGYMRNFAVILLFGVPVNCSGFAQNNTTAGLAGVGAGTALGASTGQGGTTSSSAGGSGGGSAPIEIQIMVFNGLRKIAHDVAEITRKRNGCVPTVDASAEYKKLRQDIQNSSEDLAIPGQYPVDLRKDLKTVSDDLTAIGEMTAGQATTYQALSGNIKKSGEDASNLGTDPALLGKDINTLVNDVRTIDEQNKEKKNACAVLIEDPTSANQVGLYQAVEGYYQHVGLLHAKLADYFALQVTAPSLRFSTTTKSQKVRITNVSLNPIHISGVQKTGDAFDLTAECNDKTLNQGEFCTITVTFSGPAPTKEDVTLSGQLHIPNGQTGTEQILQLTGTVGALTKEQQEEEEKANKKLQSEKGKLSPDARKSLEEHMTNSQLYTQKLYILNATPTTGSTPPTGSGAAATAPVSLTYLGDIMTALGGIKSGITYAPSASQPTTQAFEVLVEAELSKLNIMSYTSTSSLNLADAKIALTGQFSQMLDWGSQISNWTTQCKPSTGNPTASDTTKTASQTTTAPTNTACADAGVLSNLAVATQMITGYTALLSAPNDSGGNPAIVDVLRGKFLSDKMAGGIPSLQLAVAAAGGSTKTNSFFGVNLFYQFAPSYNGGVIATFELRDKDNVLLESGARNALFNYRKWKSKDFHPKELKNSDGTCSFCSED